MEMPKSDLSREVRRRRAMNIVWAAAGDYGFMPDFLAFHEDGTPDLYLNSIIGFAHRFYDAQKLVAYIGQLDQSILYRVFEDILWLGMEQAIYKRELPHRPVLEELRREHARLFLLDSVDVSMQQLMMRSEIIQTLKIGRCREILGEPHGIRNPWDRKLYEALDYPAELTTEEIIERTERILRHFFVFRFTAGRRRSWHILLGNRLQQWIRRWFGVEPQREFSIRRFGREPRPAGQTDCGKNIFAAGNAVLPLEELRAVYGKPLFPESVRRRLEAELCRGNHRYAHVYFACGRENDACRLNRAFWRENQSRYQLCRWRIRDSLKNCLAVHRQPLRISGRQGVFSPERAWRGVLLQDPCVFSQYQEESQAEFEITLLLDASESRRAQQAVLAAQGYVIAQALADCQIPVQVYSFCSIKGVTVFCRLKAFEEKHADGIFAYSTGGWNRDGLALLGVGHLLRQEGGRQSVLLVLTDANPSDILEIPAGLGRSRQYMDKAAAADTAEAAKYLRRQGVKLVALVNSVLPENGTGAITREIYGRQAAYVKSINQLADVTGRLIEQQIEENCR